MTRSNSLAPTHGRWPLSYYVGPIGYRDGRHTFEPEAARRQFDQLAEAGVRWVGFNGVNLDEPRDFDLDQAIEQIAGWLDDRGLQVSSFHFAGRTFAPLDAPQDGIRRRLIDTVRTFARWHPRALVIHAGVREGPGDNPTVLAHFAEEVGHHGLDAVMDTIADNLRAMADAAGEHDTRLALENLPEVLPLGRPQQLVNLIARIHHPAVGWCVDSGHAHLLDVATADVIRLAGDRLFETHFHDNRGSAVGADEHRSPGFGTIDWIDALRALDEVGFAGPVTFETGGWPGTDTVEGYRRAMAWWRSAEQQALGNMDECRSSRKRKPAEGSPSLPTT